MPDGSSSAAPVMIPGPAIFNSSLTCLPNLAIRQGSLVCLLNASPPTWWNLRTTDALDASIVEGAVDDEEAMCAVPARPVPCPPHRAAAPAAHTTSRRYLRHQEHLVYWRRRPMGLPDLGPVNQPPLNRPRSAGPGCRRRIRSACRPDHWTARSPRHCP